MRKNKLILGLFLSLLILSSCNNSNSKNTDKLAQEATTEYIEQLQEIINYYNTEYSKFTDNILSVSTLSDKSKLEKKEKESYKIIRLNEDATRAYSDRYNADYYRLFLDSKGVSEPELNEMVSGFKDQLEKNRNFSLELLNVQYKTANTLSVLLRVLKNNFDSYKFENGSIVFSNKQTEDRVNELMDDIENYDAKEKEIIKSSNEAAKQFFEGQQ